MPAEYAGTSFSYLELGHVASKPSNPTILPTVWYRVGMAKLGVFPLEDVQYVVHFILHYTEANAILLPGRIPGYKRDDVQLLP